MEKVLMYLIYGNQPKYWQELRFSLLSCWRLLGEDRDKVRIVICTDQKDPLPGFPVTYHHFDKLRLETWAGPAKYFHRSKNRSMADVMDRFGKPTALIDTDTCFVRNPLEIFQRIRPGHGVLHKSEGSIAMHHHQLWSLIQGWETQDRHGNNYRFDEQATMWNSGVVGLDPADRTLLDQGLDLVDALYERTHIFNMEQFGLGEVLRRQTHLQAGDDIVVHYWGFPRPFFSSKVLRFLDEVKDKPLEEQIKASGDCDFIYPKHPLWERLLTRFKRSLKGWPHQFASIFLAVRGATHQGSEKFGRDPLGRTIWLHYAYQWSREIWDAACEGQVDFSRDSARQFLLGPSLEPLRCNDFLQQLNEDTRSRWQTFWRELEQA